MTVLKKDELPISIPATTAGIGLRAEHYQDILEACPDIGWLEVHSENYFSKGGKALYYLEQIRKNYPLSFHGVGLSLGSSDELNLDHLNKLKILIDRFSPTLISEHLCWSSVGEVFFNDLLPLPYTEESLALIIKKIRFVQDYLKQQILIENIASYLEFTHSTIAESEFLTHVATQTGCGILLDVSNLHINCVNHGWEPKSYFQNIPVQLVKEIHLGGFTENYFADGSILIDTHNKPIADAVWKLYQQAIKYFGCVPTLIEWDKEIPSLNILLEEAQKATRILEANHVVIA